MLQQIVGDTRITAGIVDPNRDAVGITTMVAMASVPSSSAPRATVPLTVGAIKALTTGKSENRRG